MTTNQALVSLITRAARATDLLPTLHARALQATGGSCSILFVADGPGGRLQATSAHGLETMPIGPWTPGAAEQRLFERIFAERTPALVDATETPDLSSRLGHPASLAVAPIVEQGSGAGFLAVGLPTAIADIQTLGEVADAFAAAMELFRLREREALQHDLRELLDEFAATVSATLDVTAGLNIVCRRANRLFGADRTGVWIYDRKARHLALRASSDREHTATGERVSSDDLLAPAAAAMRRTRSTALRGGEAARTITVPLKGYRRALGALVLEGVRIDAGEETSVLDRADEVGRQVSSAIDSLQLLDEVLGSRRELEALFDAMPNLIAVSDERGRIVHANAAFCERVRQTARRLLGRPLEECIGPDLARWVRQHANGMSASDRASSASLTITDPRLGGPLVVTATPRLDREGRRAGLVMIARDEAPSRTLQHDRRLDPRVHESEKLAALGQLVAGIAHELNNPLQGVLGHIDLIRATRGLPRSQRPALKAIHREADRAARIVRNLLVFTGSRRLNRRAISLQNVLQRALALRSSATRGREVEVVRHYTAQAPRVFGDPLSLHQVFLNLIVNAEEAVAAQGRAGRIEIATMVLPAGNAVRATIRDNGGGMSPDALPHVFEPFFTTKDVGQGTGLGLSIAYGIVQDHGGSISAGNHPEGGAVVTVDLPIAEARGERS